MIFVDFMFIDILFCLLVFFSIDIYVMPTILKYHFHVFFYFMVIYGCFSYGKFVNLLKKNLSRVSASKFRYQKMR